MVCMDGQGLMSSSRRYNLSTEAEVEQFSSDTKLGPDTKGGVSEAHNPHPPSHSPRVGMWGRGEVDSFAAPVLASGSCLTARILHAGEKAQRRVSQGPGLRRLSRGGPPS